MGTSRTLSTTVDEYISGFPYEVQTVLKNIRSTKWAVFKATTPWHC
jgi:hypothetical protein